MKIALFGKNVNSNTIGYVTLILEKLNSLGIKTIIYEPFYNVIKNHYKLSQDTLIFNEYLQLKNNADFLISMGGDGTMLDTLYYVRDSGIPILGINLGRLGFLANIGKEMIIPALSALCEGNFIIDKRSLVKIETPKNPFGEFNYALNEMTVYKKNPMSMITVKVFINDEFLNAYWSDGLIISTPTGSTAYSLSCGGPIITPESENFIITPISTHNLTVRPIVIPDTSIIKIQVDAREKDYYASLDSRSESFNSEVELIVKKEDFNINLLKLNNQNFFSTIREKLLWGIDARN